MLRQRRATEGLACAIRPSSNSTFRHTTSSDKKAASFSADGRFTCSSTEGSPKVLELPVTIGQTPNTGTKMVAFKVNDNSTTKGAIGMNVLHEMWESMLLRGRGNAHGSDQAGLRGTTQNHLHTTQGERDFSPRPCSHEHQPPNRVAKKVQDRQPILLAGRLDGDTTPQDQTSLGTKVSMGMQAWVISLRGWLLYTENLGPDPGIGPVPPNFGT